jgi:(p)ppGpp synthase/HD superfamily hydrolase
MDIIDKATAFAAEKHKSQRRKYTDQAYFNHLEAVAELVRAAGVTDPSVLAAAYLHDTVEDTATTMQEVVQVFGRDISELVYWLTDIEEGNRTTRSLMSSWRLSRAPMAANYIKFADIIDNATTIQEHDRGFFRQWATEKREILMRMLEVEGGSLTEHPLFNRAWKAVQV